ncbi:MAG: TldD/PmbA family protein [Candidatus Lokiarchaeota archaeon]|nr:TldD/PmbA family protein [Candidatus Lokiarchaeota archaeon]
MKEINENLKNIDDELIKRLNDLAKDNSEYWDLRCSAYEGTSLDFTDQKSKEISSSSTIECGIRSFINGGWGFVVLKDLDRKSIENGFQKAIKLSKLTESLSRNKFKINERDPLIEHFKIEEFSSLKEIGIEEKIELVKEHEKTMSSLSSQIKNTRTVYMDNGIQSIFANSFGSFITQNYSVLRLFNLAFAQKNGLIQRAVNSVGGVGGFEIVKTEQARSLSQKTASEAIALLEAKSPLGGKFTVIMDPKLTGTFVHEAFGHAVEADLVLNKESILEGRIGEKVAIEDVTIIDDPRMGRAKKLNLPYELFGSYFVDSEGIPSQKTTIIEAGILKNYIHSLETSSRMNIKPNGHGRAASDSSRPQVRMGITLLEPKEWKLDEMIEDTKNGILCEDFQYGYTDPTTGNFQFKCRISYTIENGEKKTMMRDASLSGMTLEVLNKITAIGSKSEMNISDGMCGKGGQSVRVCDGGPFVRIEDMIVGGLS